MTMRQTAIAISLAVVASASVHAADPATDADALSLADQTKTEKAAQQSWRLFGEGALGRAWFRNPSSSHDEGRLSVDFRFDGTLAPTLRAVLSDRLDLVHRGGSVLPSEDNVNTLREAYLSWHVTPDAIADAGRINLRYGAAFGYNPTDFFKANALRTIVSIDPVSLRENRQGTVVLRGQKLWGDSSVTATFSPRLDNKPSDSTFSLDTGATNPHNRWLLAASHRFAPEFNPQLIVYGGASTPTQVGLNLSALVNRATVAFVETSAGRGADLVDQALDPTTGEHKQLRAAAGVTYTTDFNLSLTAEYEYNSAAPTQRQWDAFVAGAPDNALKLLSTAQSLQDLPVRQAVFLSGLWQDVGIRSLDLSAFVRWDAETRSREQWLETRYRWTRSEVALRWQQYSGAFMSVFGSVPQSRRVDFLVRVFL
jgi:opacity protein-like surface antigen